MTLGFEELVCTFYYYVTQCQYDVSSEPQGGWVPQIHPEGQLYFYKDVGRLRYITDALLTDSEVLKEIMGFLGRMERHLCEVTGGLPETFEIVLELLPEWDAWGYYMVDHGSRCVFWLQELDVLLAVEEEVQGLQSPSHFSKVTSI